MNPSDEELKEWKRIADLRQAILPYQFSFIQKKEVNIICGSCKADFIRPLIVAQNDPIYICPDCKKRIYIPMDWNVIRRPRRHY